MDERSVDHSGPDEETPGKHETDLNTRKQYVQRELVVAHVKKNPRAAPKIINSIPT